MMIKAMFAIGGLMLVAAAPAAAQMAAGPLPKCSATVRDSCDQGANNPKAMSAAQADASGGVGDRHSDNAGSMAGKPMMMHHRRQIMHHKMTTSTMTKGDAPADAPK